MKMPYNPKRVESTFEFNADGLCSLGGGINNVKMFKQYKFIDQPSELGLLSNKKLEMLDERLSEAVCSDNHEETLVVIGLLDQECDKKSIVKFQKRLLVIYKKLAFKKYIDIFNEISEVLNKKISDKDRKFTSIEGKIREIEHIAKLRFEG